MPKHPKGSQEMKDYMEKIRTVKLVKGSEESKAYMQELRNKRKSKKDLSKDNNVQSTDSKR
jgi:hypothetical protein